MAAGLMMAGARPVEPARIGPWGRRVEVAPEPAAPAVLRDAFQSDLYAELGLPAVEMPAGFALEERADGLHLRREADGEDMGIMSSAAFAARHAAVLARMGKGNFNL